MASRTRLIAAAAFIGIIMLAYLIAQLLRPTLPMLPTSELRVGIDASYPPFAQVADGELVGLDVDLAYALGEQIGVQVRLVNMGYDGLYDSLRADIVDVVISALLVDPSRTQDVLYTRHYFDAGLLLVSSSESAFSSLADITGKSLAIEYGSDADTEARAWLRRVLPYQIQPYELPEHALDAVRLQSADAALVDAITYLLYRQNHPDWDTYAHAITHQWIAAAIRADRVDLWMKLDNVITSMAEDGSLAAIVGKWL